LQGVLLGLGLLLNLFNPATVADKLQAEEANPVAIVVKPEGSDIMSGPEKDGTWRRLHLPPGFVVEEWGKQEDKIFVWSYDLEWGGWAAATDFQEIAKEEIKHNSRYGQAYSAGAGEKVNVDTTLSIPTIEAVLREANSPTLKDEPDFAAYIYKRSFFYHIDPAYLLAFFKKESGYGTVGAPTYTKNIGNIRCTAGYQCIDGWRKYDSWKASADDWFDLINTHYVSKGLETVTAIVYVYAPPADGNNVGLYIWQINSLVADYRAREAH
jgi:hypothetical protein